MADIEGAKEHLNAPQQAGFEAACNQLYKLVQGGYHKMVPIVSRNPETEKITISLRALCRKCNKPVMASVRVDDPGSAKTLAEFFLSRAEFHSREHKIELPRGKRYTS